MLTYTPKEFDEDRQEIIARAIHLGVEQFLLPNIDEDSILGMHQLVKDYPESVFCYDGHSSEFGSERLGRAINAH